MKILAHFDHSWLLEINFEMNERLLQSLSMKVCLATNYKNFSTKTFGRINRGKFEKARPFRILRFFCKHHFDQFVNYSRVRLTISGHLLKRICRNSLAFSEKNSSGGNTPKNNLRNCS